MRRRTYTREFKESAIELCKSSGRSAKSAAKELGICQTSLSQWIRESEEAEAGGLTAFPGHGIPRDEELAKLRKEAAEQREIIEILKKATAFFAAQKPR